jgi:hypothetical protein
MNHQNMFLEANQKLLGSIFLSSSNSFKSGSKRFISTFRSIIIFFSLGRSGIWRIKYPLFLATKMR